MATHDYDLANQSGASFRADLNNVLQAILTNNSSASAPSVTAAYMFWADTNTGTLKIRNSANDAWIELLQLDGTLTLEDGSASAVALGFRDELNTGIFSSGANNFDISIAGTARLNVGVGGINITGTVTDDGATHDGDVTFTGASANVVFDKSDNALEFADNAKATFGTGADLSISHDGTTNIIDASAANLEIRHGAEKMIACANDGQVELYHDNTKKFETTSTGSTISGNLLLDANSAEINIKAGTTSQTGALNFTFNTDSTNYSSIKLPYDTRATDGLIIDGGSYNVSIKHDAEYLIKAIGDGAVELYYDNSKKLETASGGVTVTGNLSCDGIRMTDNDQIRLGTGDDLIIYHTGNNSVIQDSGTGNLNILASSFVVKDAAGNENMIVATQNGGVELYYDNTKRLEAAQYGAIVSGTLQVTGALDMGDGDEIQLGDGDDFIIQHTGSNATLLNTTGYTNLRAETTLYLDGKDSILFRTSSSLDEKARFESTYGTLCLGTTTANGSGQKITSIHFDSMVYLEKTSTTNKSNIVCVNHRATGSTKGNAMIFRSADGGSRGSIRITASATEFNTSSDYRLKENVTLISDGITRLKALKPSRFNWIVDETNTPLDGFIAHEVSSVVPEAISGEKDAVITQALIDSGDAPDGEIDDPIYQEIDQSKLVPLLTAALQEAIAKIETLETKVAALEAA